MTGVAFTTDSDHVLLSIGDISAALGTLDPAFATPHDLVQVWNLTGTPAVRTLVQGTGRANGLALTPNRQTLAVNLTNGQNRSKIELRQVADGRLLRTLNVPEGGVAFSPDGQLLLGAGPDGATLWQVADGARVRALDTMISHSLQFTPDGQTVAIGPHLWAVAPARQILALPDGTGQVAFGPDSRLFAAIDLRGRRVQLRQLPDGTVVRNLDDKWDGQPRCIAFTPGGRLLAVGTGSGELGVWRVADGALLLHTNLAHDPGDPLHTRHPVTALAFAPDGRHLAAGGERFAQVLDVSGLR